MLKMAYYSLFINLPDQAKVLSLDTAPPNASYEIKSNCCHKIRRNSEFYKVQSQ